MCPLGGGGQWGTVNQVTVLGDGDEELDPGDWWVVSQGSTGEGEKGKKGKKRKWEKEGGTFRVPGELLFRTPEEAEAHLQAALERDDTDDGDYGDDGTRVPTRGRGVTRGRWGQTRGVRMKGTRGVRRGVPGAWMGPANPHPAGGVTCVSRLAKGGVGGKGANRANRANPPPSDPAPARQVTFQVTYGVGWGANRTTRGVGGGNLVLRESGRASRPCDWPRLAMLAGATSL